MGGYCGPPARAAGPGLAPDTRQFKFAIIIIMIRCQFASSNRDELQWSLLVEAERLGSSGPAGRRRRRLILNSSSPPLSQLTDYYGDLTPGSTPVVWESKQKPNTRTVLNPINNAGQEVVLDFLGAFCLISSFPSVSCSI